jgi:CHAT domain-containing protein
MGDSLNAAGVDVRLQENERLTGDIAAAWSHMLRAFRIGAARPGYITQSEAARVAEAAGMPFAALAFYESGISEARTPPELAHGRLCRAKLLWKLGREDDARIELNAAIRSAHTISDTATAAALDPYLTLARSTLVIAARPAEVIRQLEQAVKELEAAHNRREIPQALSLQAKAYLSQGDIVSAEHSLQAALSEIEAQRLNVSTDEERLALTDSTREATEILVGLLFDANRTRDALNAAESSKARLLLDALGRGDAQASVAANPTPGAGEAWIEYFVLPDRLLIWSITARGVQIHAVAVPRKTLERRVDAWVHALTAGDESRVQTDGKALSDLLLEPVWSDVGSAHRVIFAADGTLHRLPFAAFIIPSEARFLVEDREVSTVPSLTWLGTSRNSRWTQSPLPHVVAAVPSPNAVDATDRYSRLPAAEQDARAIAAKFPGTSVLVGHEATPSRVAAAVEDSDLFHFAGHAVIDDRRPSRSALVLADGQLLRASEVAKWRLPHTDPEGMDQRYRDSFRNLLAMVKALYDNHIPIVAGTDALAGFTLHRELELYVQAGIPPAEVLRIATLGAASVMKHDDQLGSIAPGKLADLDIIDGDPSTNISDIRRVVTVIKDGNVYDARAVAAEIWGEVGTREGEK